MTLGTALREAKSPEAQALLKTAKKLINLAAKAESSVA